MGCGSSNATGTVVASKQVSHNSQSQAPPKQTVMKADKFLSREEARERRQKVLEEKQSRSQNNARAISAQALVDQERLSTSTRRSVRSFASSSTAVTPLKVTEPSTQDTASNGPEIVQISAVVESGHQAPEVIVEESKSIISSEDREGKSGSLTGGGGPESGGPESGQAGKDKEEFTEQAGSRGCNDMKADSKQEDTAEAEKSELIGSKCQKDEERLAEDDKDRTMKNGNLHENGDSLEQWSKPLSSEKNERHAEDPVVGNDENLLEVTERSTESEEPSRGQRLSPSNQEHQEDQNDRLASQEMDRAPIIDREMGVEGKVQQRDGIQGEASDGSDEGVADLDDVEDETESEIHGGTS